MDLVNKVKQKSTTYRTKTQRCNDVGRQAANQACDRGVTAILVVERAVVDKNAELHRVLTTWAPPPPPRNPRGGRPSQMRDMLNVMLKSLAYSSAKCHCRARNCGPKSLACSSEDRPGYDLPTECAVRGRGRTKFASIWGRQSAQRKGAVGFCSLSTIPA